MNKPILTEEFAEAVRQQTNVLLGLAGASGTGKTLTALRIARGLVDGDDSKIAVADTEGGRAKHYAPGPGEKPGDRLFGFRHKLMEPPFTPELFRATAMAAEQAGFGVLIFDTASDEYEGEGGLQMMHEAALLRMAKKPSLEDVEQWQFDKLNAPAWSIPKQQHKKLLMARLRIMRIHLIFCLRAEDKIKFVKVLDPETNREKTKIQNAGWVPICEKRFMYDMTVSMTFSPENPGVPLMKDGNAMYGKMPAHLLPAFEEGKRITEETGRKLALWANGGSLVGGAAATIGGGDDPVLSSGRVAAKKGTPALRQWWESIGAQQQKRLVGLLRSELQPAATKIDEQSISFDDPATKPAQSDTEALIALDRDLSDAAEKGTAELTKVWEGLSAESRERLQSGFDQRHKPRAAQVAA
jgi:hypothetical protein